MLNEARISATAVLTAHFRALESKRSGALINDPVAEFFVDRSVVDLSGVSLADVTETRLFESNVVRTFYLDRALNSALESGIKQIVILGSGLDSRAFRLKFPAGCVLYEIDLPDVIEFKRAVVDELQLAPAVAWRPNSADLTEEWIGTLACQGWTDTRATAWIVEGVFFYLTSEQSDALVADISRSSASGSRLLAVHMGAGSLSESQSAEMSAQAAKRGYSFRSVVNDPTRWLSPFGWYVSQETIQQCGSKVSRYINYSVDETPGNEIAWLIDALLP